MFVVEGRRAKAEIRDQSEIDDLIGGLKSQKFTPVVRVMLESAMEAAGLRNRISPAALLRPQRRDVRFGRPIVGDVSFGDRRMQVVQPVGPRLQVWEVRRHDFESSIDALCDAVERAARAQLDGRRVRGMDFTWEAVAQPAGGTQTRLVSSRFRPQPKLEMHPADIEPGMLATAAHFADHERRRFLQRLAQVGRTRLIDATDASPELVAPLRDRGLVRAEVLVQCRKDNAHTSGVLENRAAFEDVADKVHCTICGRAFKDEIVLDMYSLTDEAKELSSGSKWMTVWVTGLLISSGVPRDKISWNAAAGEDEIDVITDALGPRVFFELKDRAFGLGDAYPFASRVVRYGGTYGVVLTTEAATQEAKDYFKEQQLRIQVLEGTDAIERGLPAMIDLFSRAGVLQLAAELAESTDVMDLSPLVSAWMERVARLPHEVTRPSAVG